MIPYSIVYNGIEQLIEECRKVKGHQEDLLEERSGDETQPSSQPQNPESGMRDLAVYLKTTIEKGLEVCMYVCTSVCRGVETLS